MHFIFNKSSATPCPFRSEGNNTVADVMQQSVTKLNGSNAINHKWHKSFRLFNLKNCQSFSFTIKTYESMWCETFWERRENRIIILREFVFFRFYYWSVGKRTHPYTYVGVKKFVAKNTYIYILVFIVSHRRLLFVSFCSASFSQPFLVLVLCIYMLLYR